MYNISQYTGIICEAVFSDVTQHQTAMQAMARLWRVAHFVLTDFLELSLEEMPADLTTYPAGIPATAPSALTASMHLGSLPEVVIFYLLHQNILCHITCYQAMVCMGIYTSEECVSSNVSLGGSPHITIAVRPLTAFMMCTLCTSLQRYVLGWF